MIDYTIIIPHKNIPSLLQRCLDSIPLREDVQVVVVDDNSDVELVDFSHFPKWRGNHFECYFTKEGKGAGYARNVGLEHAKGKWLVFADADDYFLPEVSDVFNDEIDTEAEIVFYRPKFVLNDDLEISSKRGGSEYNRYIDVFFETGSEMGLRTRWLSPWSKLIKKSLVDQKHFRFEETKFSNDVMFSVLTGCESAKVVARDLGFYVVTEREGSLTSHFCKKAGELDIRASVFFKAQKVVNKFGFPVDDRLAVLFLRRLFSENRDMFKTDFKILQDLSSCSRLELIRSIFEANSLLSRVKRGVYTYFMTLS